MIYHITKRYSCQANCFICNYFNPPPDNRRYVKQNPLKLPHFKLKHITLANILHYIMSKIHYIKGDATSPQVSGAKIIAHICNDIGRWGKGFVLEISKKWDTPKLNYLDWYRNKSKNDFCLGNIQIVKVENDVFIANMIAQNQIRTRSNPRPISYSCLKECLSKLSNEASLLEATIHMPRIGCGLAGGKWSKIEPLIQLTLVQNDITTFVYDLN